MSDITILRKLVFDGAKSKKIEINDVVLDRLNYELSVIEKLNVIEYFIIYSKIVEICNKQDLLRSYGRGSACGSLVNYCLDITKLNPLEHGLIFERFLIPLISTFVDIDIDIPSGYQEWVVEKLKIELPTHFIYFLATLPSTINESRKDLIINDVAYKKHACGVIITSDKKPDSIATYDDTDYYYSLDIKNDPLIDHSKFDILELEYLNKLDLIVKTIGNKYHPYNLPLNDKKVFDFFKKGDLSNIFQFNYTQSIFSKFRPDSINDLTIINAMFRPGPIANIPHLIHNKQNGYRNRFPSDIRVHNILDETYGLLVYQETLYRLLNEISGFSFSEADIFKRKLTKTKDPEEIAQLKTKFVLGCRANSSLNVKEIEQLAQLILGQILFSFQKSHSLSYSIIAYWGAYYKTHFEKEFESAFNLSEKYLQK